MADATKYVMLITSLPHPGLTWDVKRVPINRIRLEQRLRLLDERDTALLARIENVLQWNQQPIERTDAEIGKAARELLAELRDPDLHALVEQSLSLRIVVAALRMKRDGLGPFDRTWGRHPLVERIRRAWREPDLGLRHAYRWVEDAALFIANDDAIGLERLMLDLVWKQLDEVDRRHWFDSVAVVVYVLRWALLERWARNDPAGAAHRFEGMMIAGLGEHADVMKGIA